MGNCICKTKKQRDKKETQSENPEHFDEELLGLCEEEKGKEKENHHRAADKYLHHQKKVPLSLMQEIFL